MKRKKIEITCKYCDTFFSSPIEDERTSTRERKCLTTKKLVFIESKICDKFIPTIRLWCNKSGFWRNLTVCTHKIKNKHSECARCKQKKIIMKIIRDYKNEQKT